MAPYLADNEPGLNGKSEPSLNGKSEPGLNGKEVACDA
jgi:hypothetical protein